MSGFKYALLAIGTTQLGAGAFVWALCRCAARRPVYGPPVAETCPQRRRSDGAWTE